MHLNEDDTNGDILNADIPFSNRGGVNVIDVLSQVCDEVVESSLETLHEAAVNAKNSATKKEFRTKLRALEAFKEELRTRLLEHVSCHVGIRMCVLANSFRLLPSTPCMRLRSVCDRSRRTSLHSEPR